MRRGNGVLAVLAAFAALASMVLVAACGGDDNKTSTTTGEAATGKLIQKNSANSGVTIKVGSKNFTEEFILGEIYAQALQAAGYNVKKDLNYGSEQIAFKGLKAGKLDGYPEYTSTALTSFFGIKAADVPNDAKQAVKDSQAEFAKVGLVAFDPMPFTSANAVGMLKKKADELGVKNISDLEGKSQDLTLYGSPECRQRLDCLLGLQQVYGLKFKKFVPVDIARRHEVLTSGRADVSIVFTTDPQINREKEVLLEDDKGMFPPYNSTLVMKQETFDEAGGDLQKTVELLQEQLTDENMQELNARVDLDKKDPAVVAKEYLTETGLIGG
jgi:osmoprotectant transport system substrate-binding protein